MANFTKREWHLIRGLWFVHPIYPAILMDQARNGRVSLIRLSVLCLANACLIRYFSRKWLESKPDFDIDGHLSSNYGEDEQKEIVANYREYKSKTFGTAPVFTADSLDRDPSLQVYARELFRARLKAFGGALCYFAILILLFYVVIWNGAIAEPF